MALTQPRRLQARGRTALRTLRREAAPHTWAQRSLQGGRGEMLHLVSVFQHEKQVFRLWVLLIDLQNPSEQAMGTASPGRARVYWTAAFRAAGRWSPEDLQPEAPPHPRVRPPSRGTGLPAEPDWSVSSGSRGAQGPKEGLERPPWLSRPGQGPSLFQDVVKPRGPLLSHPRTRKRKSPSTGPLKNAAG